jgi:4-diphosphocytidyl-2-C-methyl-D-erythritol kinase
MSRVLVLRPSAKINLTLRVGGLRPDGFHDVRTLYQSIALSDRLTISERRGPFALASSSPGVPADRTNLVYRAAAALWAAIGRTGEPRNAHVRLVKEIPVAAGLGGGSADAAAALVGLNTLWSGRLGRAELARLAAELGSDVPFFLQGGTALGASRGEELYPVDDVPKLPVVIIKPSFGVSAADAYRWLDEDRVTGSEGSPRSGRSSELDVGWARGPLVVMNDLESPVSRRHPMIADMRDALGRAGAKVAAMAGSGSAVFGVFSSNVSRAALRGLERPDWLVLVTRTSDRREAGRRMGL